MSPRVEIVGLAGLPEVREGDDVGELIAEASRLGGTPLEAGDIVVVTQKIVSKAEGAVHDLAAIEPSALAVSYASDHGADARAIELALSESRRVVRMDRGVLITETRHGFVCANSGVDRSNLPGAGEQAATLPVDPDASAARIRARLEREVEGPLAVIVSDTFGRPWREGATDVAIGVSGMAPLTDYRGRDDDHGHRLTTTVIATCDEVAAAAELVMGKMSRVPVAVVRGVPFEPSPGGAEALARRAEHDLFR